MQARQFREWAATHIHPQLAYFPDNYAARLLTFDEPAPGSGGRYDYSLLQMTRLVLWLRWKSMEGTLSGGGRLTKGLGTSRGLLNQSRPALDLYPALIYFQGNKAKMLPDTVPNRAILAQLTLRGQSTLMFTSALPPCPSPTLPICDVHPNPPLPPHTGRIFQHPYPITISYSGRIRS